MSNRRIKRVELGGERVKRIKSDRELNCLNSCIKEFGISLNVNIVSILNKLAIECYLRCREQYTEGGYISEFSREVLKTIAEQYQCKNSGQLLNLVSKHLEEVVAGIKQIFPQVLVIDVELASRLTVACASRHLPIEISIAWDQILNIPYVPSSGIKGLVRAYFEEHGVRIDGLGPEDLFGSEESIGVLVFFDAYPVGCGRFNRLLELDVVTPHYREVEGIISEARSSPVPVLFPVIAPGTVVRVIIASRLPLPQESTKKLTTEIVNALRRGVGAKTLVGYGRIGGVKLHIHSGQKSPT